MKTNRQVFVNLFYVIIVLCSFYNGHNGGGKRYFLTSTLDLKPSAVNIFLSEAEDDLPMDTLFQIVSKEGYPISYFRKITRSVCFDEKCRLLAINLYWNITGRYLGFELPAGEFLSKTDHEPFVADDYHRLNKLLADSLSPLANFTYSELVPKRDTTNTGVDAVTSATSKNISEYVVKGAGYTTYTMWHLIYGKTQNEVMHLTEKILSPALISKILASPDLSDKYWALDRIHLVQLTTEIQDTLFSFIDDANYNLAVKALTAIVPEYLNKDAFQFGLLNKFYSGSYSLKSLIINKIKEAPSLHSEVKLGLARKLEVLNGSLFVEVLELFRKHQVNDQNILHLIANLLESNNRFKSKHAYDFLINSKSADEVVKKKIQNYNPG